MVNTLFKGTASRSLENTHIRTRCSHTRPCWTGAGFFGEAISSLYLLQRCCSQAGSQDPVWTLQMHYVTLPSASNGIQHYLLYERAGWLVARTIRRERHFRSFPSTCPPHLQRPARCWCPPQTWNQTNLQIKCDCIWCSLFPVVLDFYIIFLLFLMISYGTGNFISLHFLVDSFLEVLSPLSHC